MRKLTRSTPVFNWVRIAPSLVFCVVSCITQLIRYSRACGSYQIDRALLVTSTLLNQWFVMVKLMSTLTITTMTLHDKYVIVPVDKASNNIVFVCKSYYYECLIKEIGINNNTSGNTTYKPTSFDKDEILASHRSFMTSLNIPCGLRIYPICIGYISSIRHHTKKDT